MSCDHRVAPRATAKCEPIDRGGRLVARDRSRDLRRRSGRQRVGRRTRERASHGDLHGNDRDGERDTNTDATACLPWIDPASAQLRPSLRPRQKRPQTFHSRMRPIAVTVSVIALISSGGVAHAAGEQRKECIVAADEGQTLRDQGKLGAARERFLACAASRCPSIVSKQCTAWVEETDAAIPTVLFRVRKDTGAEILDARILVDGQPLPAAALAHALPFDPGVHVGRADCSLRGRCASSRHSTRPRRTCIWAIACCSTRCASFWKSCIRSSS